MKKILALGLIAAGAAWYFGKEKVTNYHIILENLAFDFLGISNFGFDGQNVTFKSRLRIANNSNINLNLMTGNTVVLRKLLFYAQNGEYLGQAEVNITGIEIPAHGSLEINNIPTTVPLTEIEDLLGTAWQIFQDPDSLRVKIEVEALGQTTIIEA